MYRPAMIAGTLYAALAVIFGAFAAHGLKQILPADQIQIFETGVRYQFYHSFALLITGIAFASYPFKVLKQATTLFIIGILLFSGSLYVMTLLSTQNVSLGPVGIITPIGGLCFIIGWLLLLVGILKKK